MFVFRLFLFHNQKLQVENQHLREETQSLALENQELRLGLLPLQCGPEKHEGPSAPALLKVSGNPLHLGQRDDGRFFPLPLKLPLFLPQVEMLEPQEEEEGNEEEEEASGDDGKGVPAASSPVPRSAESAALGQHVPPQQGQTQATRTGTETAPSASSSSLLLPWILWTLQMLRMLRLSDLLLGLLDSLDLDLFLRCPLDLGPSCLDPLLAVDRSPPAPPEGDASALRTAQVPSLGLVPPWLVAINELIRFDHEYTKPFFLKEEEEEPAPEVKEDEEGLPLPSSVVEDLGLSGLLLFSEAGDSGYGGSPCSPFSDLEDDYGGPGWGQEEAFATEFFPQLVSV
ncbi:X-box-binding protein 1 [Sceloporus undulatus]|uniref:X-box-binding protein 1 n=1 Tax=Sceloporus undulatus TaxID=8520 RepID=UPI001C4CBDF9|nr:X-box-binding protein 1 [Sceloporus undulatus]